MSIRPLVALALALLPTAPSAAAPPQEKAISPAVLRERGFVPYLVHWVLPERRDELLKTLPAVRVLNRTDQSVRVQLDGAFAGQVEPQSGGAFPAGAGPHRLALAVGRREARTLPVEIARGYDARIEILAPDAAPTVLPPIPASEGRDRTRGLRGDDYTLRIAEGEPRSGSFRRVFTRERKWVLATAGKEIGFDRETWRVTEGIVCDRGGAVLCLSDRTATWFVNDARVDRAMYVRIAAAILPAENPALSELLVAAGLLREEALAPYALPALQHEFAMVRARAADALAEIGSAASAPRLRNFLQVEKDAHVAGRIEAAIARIEAREKAAGAARMFWEADDRGRMAALDEMRTFPADAPAEFVLDLYRRAENAAFREVAVRMMADLPPAAVSRILTKALADPDPNVRAFALASTGKQMLLEALPAVVARLEDADAQVRGAAAATLGDFGLADAIPALLVRLEDEDKWVRHTVSAALERISSKPFRMAPDADDTQRRAVVEQWRAWWEGRAARPTPGSSGGAGDAVAPKKPDE